MSKAGALDLASGVGGKIEKDEVMSAVEKYILGFHLDLKILVSVLLLRMSFLCSSLRCFNLFLRGEWRFLFLLFFIRLESRITSMMTFTRKKEILAFTGMLVFLKIKNVGVLCCWI